MGQSLSQLSNSECAVLGGTTFAAAVAAHVFFLSDCDLWTRYARIPRGYYDGKVAWVTGASSGIGRGLCKELATRKAHLIISSRSTSALAALATELKALGARSVVLVVVDLSTGAEAAENAADSALTVHGRLDFLFNNAGISMRASAAELEMSSVHRLMEINFFAPVALARKCLPALSESRGTIVNISSISAYVHTPLRSAYCASKSGLQSFFNSVRHENPEVTVVSACPGSTHTNVSRNALGPDGKDWGKLDDSIANGLSVCRVTERTLAATACKLQVSVVAAPWELNKTRLAMYCPDAWAYSSPFLLK